MAVADDLLATCLGALGCDGAAELAGEGSVPSAFAATEVAVAAIGTAGAALARLLAAAGEGERNVRVDRLLASAWFRASIRPQGWKPPPAWDDLAGDYEAADGWVRLHTNAPHHRAAALRALDSPAERDAVATIVRGSRAGEIEDAVVADGGCAAAMHSLAGWAAHPQGAAVAKEPLIAHERGGVTERGDWRPDSARPLRGLRVLDLTRVLAGPTATRFLAGYGATVLRLDPPHLDDPIAPETTLGKRCARLDAKTPEGRERLRRLLGEADVLVHGYRPGVLEELGVGEAERGELHPGLVDVALDAYGWTGPWSGRRGFDSLVQMSSGIAAEGQRWTRAERPVPLPFQALDHATGYLMAAAVLHGLTLRLADGRGFRARCSLARTARLVVDEAHIAAAGPTLDTATAPTEDTVEETSWGPVVRVLPPLVVEGAPMRWDLPATHIGAHEAGWQAARD